MLQRLAVADFHTAKLQPLPDRYNVIINSTRISGVTLAPTINQDHEGVFRDVINELEAQLPTQTRWVHGKPETYRFEIPNDALMVCTCVHEYPDGRLVPQIAAK